MDRSRAESTIQVQCLAGTTDGDEFEKETVNPVLASPPENMSPHWRDPKFGFRKIIFGWCSEER